MKKISIIGIIILLGIKISFAQDFTDERNVASIKNVKFISSNKKDKSHALILSDNGFLSAKFNVVQDGELNATYSFVKTPVNLIFKNSKESNVGYLNDNLDFMCKTIGLIDVQIAKIRKAIDSTPMGNTTKPVLIGFDLKGYDESNIIFFNSERLIYCSFFFRRLL